MIKEAYPWIGIAIGGIIGLLVAIKVSTCISYFPYPPEDPNWCVAEKIYSIFDKQGDQSEDPS